MSIPKLDKDLAVIQKLSDLPNSADGLTAAELKAKFDEAALEIQKWLNESFIPALTAYNIPFIASEQLNADNIQEAIQVVFDQIANASSGTIANGSVTKEKLASALLNRVFGGRAWGSLDKPTEEENPSTEFPVGQIWMRPGFTVTNAAENNWKTTACTVQTEDNKVVVTGDKTYSQADAVMNLANIGQAGDRVYVLFGVKDKDGEITSLTVSLNGGEEESTSGAVHTATLSGSTLSVRFRAVWPSSSLADGSFTVENLAVVNIDQIMRQTTDCKEMTDWGAYLQTLLPLSSFVSPRELYIQTTHGIWQQFDHEAGEGEMLYGIRGGRMKAISAAKEENSVLQFIDGAPRWQTANQAAGNLGALRMMSGSYTGDGVDGRTVTLPVDAVLVYLFVPGGSAEEVGKTSENPAVIANGSVCRQAFAGFGSSEIVCSVGLESRTLTFKKNGTSSSATTALGNRSGVAYNWIAIY